jgi:hypothetical protein
MDNAFRKLSTNKACGVDLLKDTHLKSHKVRLKVQEKLRLQFTKYANNEEEVAPYMK